jgi:hypothetical protein
MGWKEKKPRREVLLLVVLGAFNGPVNDFKNVGADEITLTQHTNAGAISVKQFSVLRQLLELDFSQLHQALDLVFGTIEVLNAEGVDRDDLDTALVADFQHLCDLVSILSIAWNLGHVGRTLARASKPR